jgi:hypothetical protein
MLVLTSEVACVSREALSIFRMIHLDVNIGVRLALSSVWSMILQGVGYGISLLNGNAQAPHTLFELDPAYTNMMISLLGHVWGGASSSTWLPTIVDLVAGWVAVGAILFTIFVILGRAFSWIIGIIIGVGLVAIVLTLGWFTIPHI